MSMSKKQIAIEAAKRAFEIGSDKLSRPDYIDACEELAGDFQMMAAAAKEDQFHEEKQS